MLRLFFVVCVTIASADAAASARRTVVVTGATGGTGSKTFLALKAAGVVDVRGLVRDASKAKALLNCSKCDESEGIYVGDVTNPETLSSVMKGADSLVIATGGFPPKTMLFDGVENQVKAFLESEGPAPKDRHVMLVSMGFTTLLDTFWNKLLAHLWGGWAVGFYSLQGEASLMNANVPYTIVKCCGLDNTPAGQKHLLVGHDDKGWSMKDAHGVSRNDVANVLAAAAADPTESANLRFDFCSKDGEAQAASDVFQEAMFSWDRRKQSRDVLV